MKFKVVRLQIQRQTERLEWQRDRLAETEW